MLKMLNVDFFLFEMLDNRHWIITLILFACIINSSLNKIFFVSSISFVFCNLFNYVLVSLYFSKIFFFFRTYELSVPPLLSSIAGH